MNPVSSTGQAFAAALAVPFIFFRWGCLQSPPAAADKMQIVLIIVAALVPPTRARIS